MDNYPEGSDNMSAPWNAEEYSASDMEHAVEHLFHAITTGQELWDENLEGYRLDMLVCIETILFDSKDDKMGRINDITDKYVSLYCNEEVYKDPNRWCSRYVD